MSIEEFRKEILSALLEKTNTKGEPRFDEASAKELPNQKSVGYKSIDAFSFLF